MLKLASTTIVRIIFIVTAILTLYFVYELLQQSQAKKESTQKQNNTSIFGRNVYANNTSLGKVANPEYEISYPDDHFAHRDFDIEWWYLTANLEDAQGKVYGLQWTLFRFRDPVASAQTKNSWNDKQLYMAHASVHSLEQHWFTEKFAKGGVGNAGIEQQAFSLFIDNWQWLNTNNETSLFPATLRFNVSNSEGELNVQLNMQQTGPFIKQGKNGYSIKSADGKYASHYYSAPFIEATGSIEKKINGKYVSSEVQGVAWYDHEWTSQLLDATTLGWDWLSLHLDDGSKIMAFRMRIADQTDYITGTFISPTGKQTHLSPTDIRLRPIKLSRVANKELPLHWQLSIAQKGIDLQIEAVKADQWNKASVSYYEGMVNVSGSKKGKGFLELTGY